MLHAGFEAGLQSDSAIMDPRPFRAIGSRKRAPDDRRREAIQELGQQDWIASWLTLLAMTAENKG
jgi:hypothetical protein